MLIIISILLFAFIFLDLLLLFYNKIGLLTKLDSPVISHIDW